MCGGERSPTPADGRVALVTGGDRGVGLRIVRRMAALGMRVVSASRSVQRARLSVDLLGDLADRVAVRELDSADPTSVARLVTWLTERLGRCDVLVNTAAVLPDDRVSGGRTSLRSAATADVDGACRLARAVLPLMRVSRYGRIVTMIGVSEGTQPRTRGPAGRPVTASELALLTSQLADEVVGDGILVNAYWPYAAAETSAGTRLHPAAPTEVAVWLATLPEDGPTGLLHR